MTTRADLYAKVIENQTNWVELANKLEANRAEYEKSVVALAEANEAWDAAIRAWQEAEDDQS